MDGGDALAATTTTTTPGPEMLDGVVRNTKGTESAGGMEGMATFGGRQAADIAADATRLTAEAMAAARHGAARLEDLTQRAEAMRIMVRESVAAARGDVESSHEEAMRRREAALGHIERAAKALAVRALEVDTAGLRLAGREAAVTARERDADVRDEQLVARAASARYAAVDQARLHAKMRALDARAERVAGAGAALADRSADAAARDARLAMQAAQLHDREADLDTREAALKAREATIRRAHDRALLQIEADRATFWHHQQRTSADVARLVDDLAGAVDKLRKEADATIFETRASLAHVKTAVANLVSDVATAVVSSPAPTMPQAIGANIRRESKGEIGAPRDIDQNDQLFVNGNDKFSDNDSVYSTNAQRLLSCRTADTGVSGAFASNATTENGDNRQAD